MSDVAVGRDGDQVTIAWRDGDGRHQARFDRLLAATGRRANVDGLGL